MAGKAILCLDQSLSGTGFALLAESGELTTGSWVLCDGIYTRSAGFRELFTRLDALHKCNGIGLIAHEEPISGRMDTTPKRVALFGLVAIIELFSISRGIECRSYPAQSWRTSFFTKEERRALRGFDWKHAAIARSRQLGLDPKTDDEAEAFAILDHHLLMHRIQPEWRKSNEGMLEPVA